jgi:hypothetical protein
MGKKKTIRHIGMSMTEEEHRKWHQEHPMGKLSAHEHDELMTHLGVSKEDDEKWHKARASAPEQSTADDTAEASPVNPFAIGGGFLQYCVGQGWLIQQGRGKATKYHVTPAGRQALAEYGIVKY